RLAAKRCLRSLVGGVLTLLVLGALAPRASASCGDYVTMPTDSNHSDPPGHPPAQPVTKPSHPDPAPLPVRAPCRSPGCSDRPAPFPSPLSTPAPDTQPRSDGLLSAPFCACDDGDDVPLEETHCQRIHRVSPIYHPPRTV